MGSSWRFVLTCLMVIMKYDQNGVAWSSTTVISEPFVVTGGRSTRSRSIRNSEFNHRQLESFTFGPIRIHSLVHEASEIGQDVKDCSNACSLVFPAR